MVVVALTFLLKGRLHICLGACDLLAALLVCFGVILNDITLAQALYSTYST